MPGVELLLSEIASEFPRFRILAKSESRLMRWIDFALRLITLGQQTRFLTEYHTVLGCTLFVAPGWDTMSARDKMVLLRHERVHLRQSRRLGAVAMAFVYLVPFFPLGLAYGRARLEWEAYRETLRATFELKGLEAARSVILRHQIVERFTGPDYGWMWPFRKAVEAWYDTFLGELCQSAPTTKPPQFPAKLL